MSAPQDASNPPNPARIKPGSFRELGPLGWVAARLGARVAATEDVHLFSTLGQARRLFPAWLAYSAMMMPFGVLTRRDTELVILHVAHLRGSVYERNHHEKLGARIGLSRTEIERTTEDPKTANWSERERILLLAAQEIVTSRDLSEGTWERLSHQLAPAELVAFVQLVTQYDGLATSMQVLRVQPDTPR